MYRRDLVRAAVASAMLPAAAVFGSWTDTGDWSSADYVFFDARFARAGRCAAELAPHTPLTPVLGDVTDIWNAGIGRAGSGPGMRLHGVTTESFYFCLGILLGAHAQPHARIARLDRDLHLWSIRTDRRHATG